MEQPFAKPKFRIWPKIAFLIAVILIYLFLYSLLRINKDMVHVINEKNDQHSIEVLMPENHKIFMEALENGENSTEIDRKIKKEVNFYRNKKRYIEAFFLPARVLEVKCRETI
ncbi:MAG: hypothetical protein ACI94Y_001053 [Maribacter sp.]|jgi:hypothetical protein